MNRIRSRGRWPVRVVLLVLCLFGAADASAQTLTWDPNTLAAGTGGSGAWDTTTPLWFNGTSFVPWTSTNSALFDGTAGTVTLATPIGFDALTFQTPGYVVTGGSLLTSATHSIATIGTTTIASAIEGAGNVSISGGGQLILTGTNTYSGGTTVSAGTLQIGNGGTTGSVIGSIVNGGVLTFFRADSASTPFAITTPIS